MKDVSVEEAIRVLSARSQQYTKDSVTFQQAFLSMLAQSQPVDAASLAKQTGFPLQLVQDTFEHMKSGNYEFENDALVGAALTLKPTPHRFNVNGHQLYAWCALDTLFLPAYIGQIAIVESTCPMTGEHIQLEVAPHGVLTHTPDDIAVSVVVNAGCTSGPNGSFCGRIHFFAGVSAAENWAAERDDIAVFNLKEAYQIADEVYIKPFQNLLTL